MKEVLSAETKRKLAELDALEAGGVDNWGWYSDSLEPLDGVEFTDDPEPESAWQPIETAPKTDGFECIIYDKAHRARFSAIWRSDEDWDWWYVDDFKHGPYPIRGQQEQDITHWMPLPPPPEETTT